MKGQRRKQGGHYVSAGTSFIFAALLSSAVLLLEGCMVESFPPNSISGQLELATEGLHVPEEIPPVWIGTAGVRKGKIAREQPEMVPGQVLVRLKQGVSPASVMGNLTSGNFKLRTSSGTSGQGHLLMLSLEEAEELLSQQCGPGRQGAGGGTGSPGVAAGAGSSKMYDQQRLQSRIQEARSRTLREIEYLKTLPAVALAQPNYIYRPLFLPNDEYYRKTSSPHFERHYRQWNLPLIKMDHVWQEWPTGSGLVPDVSSVTVAVLDTGIAREGGVAGSALHPDFYDAMIVDEYDFISSDSRDGDDGTPGMDGDATDVGDDMLSFHGTHVAGIIAAHTGNSAWVAAAAGGHGYGKGARIMPLRVLGSGGGTTYDIAQAVLYAAGLPNASGQLPDQRADIINMSLGGPFNDSELQEQDVLKDAVNDAAGAGVLVVASAGNTGTQTAYYPAAYDNVVSVSAVGISGAIAPYSTYHSTVDIAAPGGDMSFDLNFDTLMDGVLSTMAQYSGSTGTYSFSAAAYEGTSMAAPHVSAVAALMLAADSGLTLSELRSGLQSTAIDLGSSGKDIFYGYGMLNAYEAVALAKGIFDLDPVLFPKSSQAPYAKRLRLTGTDPSGSFTLENIGDTGDTIIIDGLDVVPGSASNWVTVTTDKQLPASLPLQVNVLVDSSGIEDGYTRSATVELTWNSSPLEGSEFTYVQYNSAGFNDDPSSVGDVYVVAIDYITDTIAHLDVTTVQSGLGYLMEDVEPGTYYVGASTDNDADGWIFDAGEVFGFYPNVLQIEVFSFQEGDTKSGMNFPISRTFYVSEGN
jgi:serine protease